MISTEHLMQMGPMLVLAALMMGLLAETVWRAGGNGLLNDMILGLAGRRSKRCTHSPPSRNRLTRDDCRPGLCRARCTAER